MINGVLLIDKPVLYTSHDVVDVVRRKIGQKRVGHAGTLDPMATGLLLVLLGNSTSLFEKMSAVDKKYDGIVTLGVETVTQDAEGAISASHATDGVTASDVEAAMRSLTGDIEQMIPRYSAAKIKGKKGYQLARKGTDFEPGSKQVVVYDFRLHQFQNPDVHFSSHVSKGTYVRVLASDLGKILGVGGMLSSLRRTHVADFDVRDAYSMANFLESDLASIRDHAQRYATRFAAEVCGATS